MSYDTADRITRDLAEQFDYRMDEASCVANALQASLV